MINTLGFSIAIILIYCSISTGIAQTKQVFFQHEDDALAGYYISPKNTDNEKAIIIFVHGDGPMNYQADGYYPLIWNRLLELGYAIFSWDKPGIGNSTGHWLDQSMADRQSEVHAAIKFIQNEFHYSSNVGLFGFSQAGWVIPAVAKDNANISFVIGIGFAMNWLEQSWYLTKTRLALEGKNQREIAKAYKQHLDEIEFIKQGYSHNKYLKKHKKDFSLMSIMPEQRYLFVLKNVLSDASDDYKDIQQPILILLGENDLNVDVQNTHKHLTKIFYGRNNLKMFILPNATHGLLKTKDFNKQKPDFSFWLKLMWQGKKAFAPSFFTTLEMWLEDLNSNIQKKAT